ncbi:hypothetical protein EON64_08570 [archaeon]|nr:MAG: hypothetical protein EON64_08570 [archaeon]
MALEDALKNPGVQVAIVGPTFKQTKAIVSPLMNKILESCPEGLVTQHKSTSVWNLSNGSSVVLGGFDTILEAMRGLDIYSIYLEETGLATSDLEEYFYLLYSVLFPTMMHSRGRLTHLTTPAKTPDHPLHTETKLKCEQKGAFYQYTIRQNPLLTEAEIAAEIDQLGGPTSISTRRELFCEIVRDESITVVPQFEESVHVSLLPLSYEHLSLQIAGDLGYTKDLSVFHLMGYSHDLAKTLILGEKMFPAKTPTTDIVAGLSDWRELTQRAVVDIQGNTRVDMSSMGFGTSAPIKDHFEPTVSFIRDQFYRNSVLIDPTCTLLIQTLRSQTFNKQKTDYLRTSTLGHADALMSLIYGLRSIDKVTDLRPRPAANEVFTAQAYLAPQHANLRKLFK